MSFTPGPWTVARRNEYEPLDQVETDQDAVADCSIASDGRAVANARLIASAPALLAALKKARRRVCGVLCMEHEILSTSHHPDCTEYFEVIAKAEGK